MKKISAFVLLLCVTLNFISCSSASPSPEETSAVTSIGETASDTAEEMKWTEYNGYYFDKAETLDENSVIKFGEKLENIYKNNLLEAANVWYSVIPDRAYYTEGVTEFDYGKMFELLSANITDIPYIDITEALSLDCYYKTDLHWRQEKLFDVCDALGAAMDFGVNSEDFTSNPLENYVGMYSGSAVTPETLYYLTSEAINSAYVEDFQYPKLNGIYSLDALTSKTPYDVFLHGATPLVTITNESAASNRNLIIFRDSFTSSLAPLLTGEYKTITLVDIRYMVSSLLNDYVDFKGADVLFLYNVAVINRSTMLR